MKVSESFSLPSLRTRFYSTVELSVLSQFVKNDICLPSRCLRNVRRPNFLLTNFGKSFAERTAKVFQSCSACGRACADTLGLSAAAVLIGYCVSLLMMTFFGQLLFLFYCENVDDIVTFFALNPS